MTDKSPSPPQLRLPDTGTPAVNSFNGVPQPVVPLARSVQGVPIAPRSNGGRPGDATIGSPRAQSPAAPVEMMIAARARRRSSNSQTGRPKFSGVGSATSATSSPRLVPISGSPSKPLSTNSPVALAAAAAVTGEKIARLLKAQGPLAIRHITSHLAMTIQGFGDLSLSKQRRLIIAVLDNGDPTTGIFFDKVGWGRWAVRTDAKEEPTASSVPNSSTTHPKTYAGSFSEHDGSPEVRAADPRLDPRYDRASFSEGRPGGSSRAKITLKHLLADTDRRESISRQLPSHRPPLSPRLAAEEGDVVLDSADLYKRDDPAVFSDSEDEDHHDTDEEDWASMGPANLRAASPREQEAIAALVQLRSV